MEKKLSDNRTSIIINAIDSSKDQLNALANTLSKNKSDIEVLLLVNKNAYDKTIDDLIAKNKIILIELKNKKLSTLISEALTQASGSYCVISTGISLNIGNLLTTLSANKKNISSSAICIGNKNAKGKTALTTRLFNSIIRFFTPLNLTDCDSGLLFSKTEFAQSIFENNVFSANSFLSILYQLKSTNVSLKEIAISAEKNTETPSFISAIFNSIGIKINYFLTAALAEMKLKNDLKIADASHPFYRLLFFVLMLLAMFFMPYLSADFGSTWDEKAHNDYAQLSYNWYSSFGSDTAALAEPTNSAEYVRQAYRYYGEQMNTVSAFLYNWFETGTYETRHFVNSIYGLIGILFCALACVELAGWRAGILGLLFMFFNPSWLGNSMNNPTDIPFATGFAFSIYYFIKIFKSLPKPKTSHLILLAIGIGIAMGSRIGALLIVAYFGLFLGVNWLSKLRDKSSNAIKLIWPYAKIVLIVTVLGYAFGVITWAFALHAPFTNPFVAFAKANENAFYTNNVEIFEGNRMYMLTEAPWYYVAKFISIANPIYLLFGFFLSIPLAWFMKSKIKIGYLLMLFFMVFFPVIYAEYSNLNYYNGWRHYLFILPAMVILSVVSFEFLIASKHKIISICTSIILLALFALPLKWIIKNHPNEYVYFNEFVGGINGAFGSYETDYYSNSCREAAEWIAKQHPNDSLIVAINNETTTAQYWASQINPKISFVWAREYEEQKQPWDYMLITSRTYSKNELLKEKSFPPKGTVYTVMADDVPLAAVVKRQNYFMSDGYALLEKQNFDTAIYLFEKAVEWNPADEEAHRMLGFALMASGKLDSSEKHLKKAIEIFPENYSAYSNLGLVYFNKKSFKEANKYFDVAVKYKENLTEAWYYSALAYLNMSDYTNAIKQLESAAKHNGNTFEVYYYLGKSYEAINNLNKAREALEMALGINQSHAQAWFDLANIYQKLGNKNAYDGCMQRYKSLGGS